MENVGLNENNIKAAAANEVEKDHIADNHEDDVVSDIEEEDSKFQSDKELDLGPQVSLKEQLEKDKDDDSLRRWKEQLLGSVDMSAVGVDHTKVMLGSFSPQQEPYTYELEEETTPSGFFARGSYAARTKIVDDDGKCYLEVSCYFEIQKLLRANF